MRWKKTGTSATSHIWPRAKMTLKICLNRLDSGSPPCGLVCVLTYCICQKLIFHRRPSKNEVFEGFLYPDRRYISRTIYRLHGLLACLVTSKRLHACVLFPRFLFLMAKGKKSKRGPPQVRSYRNTPLYPCVLMQILEDVEMWGWFRESHSNCDRERIEGVRIA